MEKLERLQEAKDKLKDSKKLSDLADLLNLTASGISYILYKMDGATKYHEFTIPKKTGGVRTIHAPHAKLAQLQKRLAELLYDCVELRKQTDARFWFASHGFHKERTIISNAEMHKRRRFVFNIDLKDFFGTINFGRVRGFFIKDAMFKLDPKIATIIAQIACHDNKLPQGSPCSPVISNLIGNILDSRLLALARDARCTYTRYADDLTFSTNKKDFSPQIAVNTGGEIWDVAKTLKKAIKNSGFSINSEKTRMSLRQSRQTVTGLVVNDKVNIPQDYYRATRAMCDSVFKSGKYHDPNDITKSEINNLNPLEGRLSYIYFIKARLDRKNKKINALAQESGEFKSPEKTKDLYGRFLFYKYFVALKEPLIVTEGITDIIYLECALKALAENFPQLAKKEEEKVTRFIKFFKRSDTLHDILKIHGGASGQKRIIQGYKNKMKIYKIKPMNHPVIILCDNDAGAKDVFNISNEMNNNKIKIGIKSNEPFYHLTENLYLVKIPEDGEKERAPEDLFPKHLLQKKLDGKSFNKKNTRNDSGTYGKTVFAKSVVQAKAKPEDFSDFKGLLERIEGIINDYQGKLAVNSNAKTP